MWRFFALASIAFALLLILSGRPFASAQSATQPKVLITWQPLVYVPGGYLGRPLPTASSRIRASVAVVDGGKVADLSGQEIYWYVNDEFVEGANNGQTIEFRVADKVNTFVDLRVKIPGYKGGVLKTIEIPVVPPQVAVEALYPNGVVTEKTIEMRGVPYFFNVSKLALLGFSWTVDGKAFTVNDPLAVSIPIADGVANGTVYSVALGVRHPVSIFETASHAVNLVYAQR